MTPTVDPDDACHSCNGTGRVYEPLPGGRRLLDRCDACAGTGAKFRIIDTIERKDLGQI